VPSALWDQCLQRLEQELSDQQLNTWIRPLQPEESESQLSLFAPNSFVMDWVKQNFLKQISTICQQIDTDRDLTVSLNIGSNNPKPQFKADITQSQSVTPPPAIKAPPSITPPSEKVETHLNIGFTFDSFVEGKSNQLAKAASIQVVENPGVSYNPLFLYGGVGLGKTHLMHAVGNKILKSKENARIVYLHSERFVTHMIKALQHNTMDDFKQFYRSLDVLLIDDIQFFAGKERSQEEFFHTFNALLEGGSQIILTCDRYPKEIDGLDERLKSRFGWGLPVCIEPPELETRVAILQKKAEEFDINCYGHR